MPSPYKAATSDISYTYILDIDALVFLGVRYLTCVVVVAPLASAGTSDHETVRFITYGH